MKNIFWSFQRFSKMTLKQNCLKVFEKINEQYVWKNFKVFRIFLEIFKDCIINPKKNP
jgi:hypothetical protein